VSSVIGVDLGGTKVAVASLLGRHFGESEVIPTDRSGSGALIDQLVAMVGRVRGDNDLDAIGIGVPSIVEFDTGRVVSSVNIPLKDVPLRQVLGERLGVPVFVDNDATVAALAEAHDAELRLVAHNLVMITVGTGVGGGIVLGGRIYRGATGGAGELGHTLVGLDLSREAVPAPTHFPQPGSLEAVAAGHALDKLAVEAAELVPESALGRLRAEGKEVAGAEAVDCAEHGDPAAQRIIEIWAERVGIGIANAINTFDPEEVVIGGGAARAGDRLLETAKRVARGYVVPGLGRRTNVRLAWHGVRAGVPGAALLAAQEVEVQARMAGSDSGSGSGSGSGAGGFNSAADTPAADSRAARG
jgi:glucokinase